MAEIWWRWARWTRRNIARQRRKRKGFDEDESGRRIYIDTDARYMTTKTMGTRRIRYWWNRQRTAASRARSGSLGNPESYVRDLSLFVSQFSLFGARGAGGNGFGVGRGRIVGGGGGGSLEIIQAMHMDQLPLYASQGFGGGVSSSGGNILRGRVRMNPWRRGGWRISRQRRGYVVIFISTSFVIQGANQSYYFACPTKPRGWHILSLLEA